MSAKHPSQMSIEELWTLPSVNVLAGRSVRSFEKGGGIWEVGWNGSWVKAWSDRNPPYEDPRVPPKWDYEVTEDDQIRL